MTKIQKLLPPIQLLPSEWSLVESILKDYEESEGDVSVKFWGDGTYTLTIKSKDPGEWFPDTGWEFAPDWYDVYATKDLDINVPLIRYLLGIDRSAVLDHFSQSALNL